MTISTEHPVPEDRQDPAAEHLPAETVSEADPGPDAESAAADPASLTESALPPDPAEPDSGPADPPRPAEPVIVSGEDDPAIFEEFGAQDSESEQGVYDWFALDMVDPLDVDDDERDREGEGKFRSPAGLPSAASHDDPAPANTPVRDPEPAAHAGRYRRSTPGDEKSGRPSPEFATNPAPAPEEEPADPPSRPGVAGLGRLQLPSRSGRRLLVLLLAILVGVALMVPAGPDRARLLLDRIFAMVNLPTSAGPLPGISVRDTGETPVILPAATPAAPPAPEARTHSPPVRPDMPAAVGGGLAGGMLQIDLQPVAVTASLLPIGTARQERWDRLFEFVDQPPPDATGEDIPVPEDASDPPEMPALPPPALPDRDFTPDDGFAPTLSINPLASPINMDLAGYGADGLATQLTLDDPAINPVPDESNMAAAQSPAIRQQVLDRIGAIEVELTGLTEQLASFDRRLNNLPYRQSAAELQAPSAVIISERFRQPGARLESADGGRYLISASTDGAPPAPALAGIGIGDHVEDFGRVIDITRFDDGGQLYVMENGAVFID